jgi:predicted nucleic acid-binding protein
MTSRRADVIVDSDALIALFNPRDAHAAEAMDLLQFIESNNLTLLYPVTTIVETVTAFQRKLSLPKQAWTLIDFLRERQIPIEPVDQSLIFEAVTFLRREGSKKNTLFDAVVAALAKRHGAYVFSFDQWYEKLGLPMLRSSM